MSQSEIEYLRHILQEAEYLADKGQTVEEEHFLRDDTLKRATVRSIEIIGEATKQLSEALRQKYPEVAWKSMAGMRDRLIHGYFSVDYDIVWDVMRNEAPVLMKEVRRIIEKETATGKNHDADAS